MQDLIVEQNDRIQLITLNRIEKHNAFDDSLLLQLQTAIESAEQNSNIRVIVLKANGRHFSAGADIAWMQRMAKYNEADNLQDAMILARLMYTLHQSKKPLISMIQGAAFGGGAGLVATSDIAIASDSATFCFSEVKLGLIPAVISPYVIKAIGERAASWLFMSAETVNAHRALELGLIHHCVPEDSLLSFTLDYAKKISLLAPQAICEAKALVRQVTALPIDEQLLATTASLIAKKRVSAEGQQGLHAFLNKTSANWT